MIKYILSALLLSAPASATKFDVDWYLSRTHVTVGIAHKLSQTLTYDDTGGKIKNSPTARMEVYYQYSKHVKFGVSHHSQWLEGAPFNDRFEYSKTELFIDYTFSLGDVF